ncbi:MAG: type II toxin-antitoxin system PemK/MazF family toxin [Verrucomicrobiae bacterium]
MKRKMPQVPELGAIGWLVFDPQAGREQAGRRPALVLSHTRYNAKTGLAVFCPITSREKGYPFELPLPAGLPVSGVVLCDHVRSLDWQQREWQPICKTPSTVVQDVLARMLTLFDLPEI